MGNSMNERIKVIVMSRLEAYQYCKKHHDKPSATHKKLAQRIGCDTSTVTKHINGDLGISVEFLTKYADVFDVSLDYLTGRKKQKRITEMTDREQECQVANYLDLSIHSIKIIRESKEPAVRQILDFMLSSEMWLPFSIFCYELENCKDFYKLKNNEHKLLVKLRKEGYSSDNEKATIETTHRYMKYNKEYQTSENRVKSFVNELINAICKGEKKTEKFLEQSDVGLAFILLNQIRDYNANNSDEPRLDFVELMAGLYSGQVYDIKTQRDFKEYCENEIGTFVHKVFDKICEYFGFEEGLKFINSYDFTYSSSGKLKGDSDVDDSEEKQ